jgi:hypothetical protein
MPHFIRVPISAGSVTINADRVTYIREFHGREAAGAGGVGSCEVYFDAGQSVTVNLTVEALVALTAKR